MAYTFMFYNLFINIYKSIFNTHCFRWKSNYSFNTLLAVIVKE